MDLNKEIELVQKISKEDRGYFEGKHDGLSKRLEAINTLYGNLKTYIADLNDKMATRDTKSSSDSEKLHERLSEQESKSQASINELQNFVVNQKKVNVELEKHCFQNKTDVVSLKETCVRKDVIASIIEKELSENQMQENVVIKRLKNDVVSCQKDINTNRITNTQTMEKISKLCTEEYVENMMNEIKENHENLRKSVDMQIINDVHSAEVKSLSEKQIKLKAAFKEVQDFIENQSTINADIKQKCNLMKSDLSTLKTNHIGKEAIESLIHSEVKETMQTHSNVIKSLSDDMFKFKRNVENNECRAVKNEENLKQVCTKDAVCKMIENALGEQLKKLDDMKMINNCIERLENHNKRLEEQINESNTKSVATASNLSDSFYSTLKESSLAFNKKVEDIQAEVKRVEKILLMLNKEKNSSPPNEKISEIENCVKVIETKLKQHDASTINISKLEERITKVSSKVNKVSDTVTQSNTNTSKTIESMSKKLDKLKKDSEEIQNHSKTTNSDLNDDIEWVKNHIDILRGDQKSKFIDLSDRIKKENEKLEKLKLETNSSLVNLETKSTKEMQKFLESQMPGILKTTKESVETELKRLESKVDSQGLSNNKNLDTFNEAYRTKEKEFEKQISMMKLESSSISEIIESIKRDAQKFKESLECMDGKIKQFVQSSNQQKGKQ